MKKNYKIGAWSGSSQGTRGKDPKRLRIDSKDSDKIHKLTLVFAGRKFILVGNAVLRIILDYKMLLGKNLF